MPPTFTHALIALAVQFSAAIGLYGTHLAGADPLAGALLAGAMVATWGYAMRELAQAEMLHGRKLSLANLAEAWRAVLAANPRAARDIGWPAIATAAVVGVAVAF